MEFMAQAHIGFFIFSIEFGFVPQLSATGFAPLGAEYL